jgi:hypothetical protein
MSSSRYPVRATSLAPASIPEGHVLVFRLGGFASQRARKPLVEAWSYDLLDLPIGHGFAHGADEERVEAFYARRGSRQVEAAEAVQRGEGPHPVEPHGTPTEASDLETWVWAFSGHERPYALRWDALAYARTAWSLPIGGWVRQGLACERIRRVKVARHGSEATAASSNEGSAHSQRMRDRFDTGDAVLENV